MERVTLIQYHDRTILQLDFSHCTEAEAEQVAHAAKREVVKHAAGSLRTLTDITSSPFNDHIVSLLKDLAKHNKTYVAAGAVVGVTGMKRIILQAVEKFSGRTFNVCDSIEQAQDWLATH